MRSQSLLNVASGLGDSATEYAAIRNEIAVRISMVSEQGFSAAIAMFAIFSMYVGLAAGEIDNATAFCLLDSMLAVLAAFYLCLAALKSGENIRQIVKLATYSKVFYEEDGASFH